MAMKILQRSKAVCWIVVSMLPTGLFQSPTGEEILRRCLANAEAIEDYVVDLDAKIDMERLRIPAMKATMYYKKPDKVHFQSENFMMLPREGFAMPVAVLISQYDAVLKGKEEVNGALLYRLQLSAKRPSSRIQNLSIWVDPVNFTLVRTTGSPYRGRSVEIRLQYKLFSGNYWLPEQMIATFSSVGPDSADLASTFAVPGKPQLEELWRPPRNGSIEVYYSNYRINTGLSDEIFQREME